MEDKKFPYFEVREDMIPEHMETQQDLEQMVTFFMLPFLRNKMIDIGNTIFEMFEAAQNATDENPFTNEQKQEYISKLERLSAFADPNHPMNCLFTDTIELQTKLARKGTEDEAE